MKYEHKLIIRIILLFIFLPHFFYLIFALPTLFLSSVALKLAGFYIITDYVSKNIMIDDIKLNFISACIATTAYQLLAILILLTKELSFKKMLKIFVVGSLMILIINVLRILLLSSVYLNYGFGAFKSLHIFLWKGVASIMVFIVWILLIKIFKITAIPIYSDIIYLYQNIKRKKRKK